MSQEIIKIISSELKLKEKNIETVLNLLEEGNTVPFIARYRKEKTGSMDEEQIRVIEKEFKYREHLASRKEEVIRLIDEKKMLTPELKNSILKASKLQEVEDIYLPFKEKRKTKATEAIKQGLEPLADKILSFDDELVVEEEAKKYITEEVKSVDDAIEGAKYIIAERIVEKAEVRKHTRNFVNRNGFMTTKSKKNIEELDPKEKYKIYYDFNTPIRKLKSYNTLAINRAEKEKIITVKITIEEDEVLDTIIRNEILKSNDCEIYVLEAIVDGFNRLLFPSIEREIRVELKKAAEEKAIKIFGDNLDALILEAPLKNKTVLGVDPAYRTGCKLAIINENLSVKKIDKIYPNPPQNDKAGSIKVLERIFKDYKIDQIVVGNGTASRESEKFMKDYVKKNNLDIPVSIVSEAGASVYSASKIAIEEFPDYAVEERSAVSIARRIIDPMAELVKIDPKSIGVGQYQHDVNQKNLAENLDFVMIKNINRIGVDLNTASKQLLKYVSGLDNSTATNIVTYREENGSFTKRSDLLNVKRLGKKAYTQCAGFLKIRDGLEKLDMTFIHPESYKITKDILKDNNIDLENLGTEEFNEQVNSLDVSKLAQNYDVSEILVEDILLSIVKPNHDIRDELKVAEFDSKIQSIDDIVVGITVQGQVRNIVDFGAFVDIGIKNDGLLHISQISKDKYVKEVSDEVKIGDVLNFVVKDVDKEKNRVQLSLIGVEQ